MNMPVPPPRHALNLPAGSVRAIHVLAIVGLICAIIMLPVREDAPHTIPPYLIYLLFLMLGHYFASHGGTIAAAGEGGRASPLYLPGGTVRVLIVLALVGCIGWKLYSDQANLIKQFEGSLELLKQEPVLPLIILGGFLVGVIARVIMRGIGPHAALQDLEAWLSLLALLGILIAGVIHLIVDPSLEQRLYLPIWESFVGGVVAFYFGARSS